MLRFFLVALLFVALSPAVDANESVYAFFYTWYGTPEQDGRWLHWNHSVLPHWTEAVRRQYPEAAFVPPHDLHSPFFPAKGPYSSANRTVIRQQLKEMRESGIGVAVVSWWGRPDGSSSGDSQGVVTERILQTMFEVAEEELLKSEQEGGVVVKLALHMEPYHGRDIHAFRKDVQYLSQRYGGFKSWHRIEGKPAFFVYDSYHVKAEDWALLLKRDNTDPRAKELSLRRSEDQEEAKEEGADAAGLTEIQRQLRRKRRGLQVQQPKRNRQNTKSDDSQRDSVFDLDGFFIGLWLERHHGDELKRGGFDGTYSYFSSDGFSYGSTTRNWRDMATKAKQDGLLFIPCVGPGYDDTRIRPWNAHTRKDREQGRYYRRMWEAALNALSSPSSTVDDSGAVAITSFNEWGEGTQIEPAVPRSIDVDVLAPQGLALSRELRAALRLKDRYDDYDYNGGDGDAASSSSSSFYLRLTKEFSDRLRGMNGEKARGKRAPGAAVRPIPHAPPAEPGSERRSWPSEVDRVGGLTDRGAGDRGADGDVEGHDKDEL